MPSSSAPQLIMVGSIGLDNIRTPAATRENLLGGSASYAAAAASFFTSAGLVGVVGTDFPRRHETLWRRLGINLRGLQRVRGKTFRWSGEYEQNMDHRRTLDLQLNVFADFQPKLPQTYRAAPFLFLANISPELQLRVLDQMTAPRFVMADTMDCWIQQAREGLEEVIRRVDLLTLNESEARLLTGETSLLAAARQILRRGPAQVIIKRGENGSVLFSDIAGIALMPAYPLESVVDPTGAGDTFAGGFIGRLAAAGRVTAVELRRAMLYGNILASFGVEAFSLDRLAQLDGRQIADRIRAFRRMCRQP